MPNTTDAHPCASGGGAPSPKPSDHPAPHAAADAEMSAAPQSGFFPFELHRWWCAWRLEQRPPPGVGHQKIPYVATAPERRAKTNRPGLWLPRARADDLAACFAAQGFQAGTGILLGQRMRDGFRLCALDLDACLDPNSGSIADWALPILAAFAGCFAEVSPSGRGLHLMFLLHDDDLEELRQLVDDLPRNGRKWQLAAPADAKAPAIELLLGGYITVTDERSSFSGSAICRPPPGALAWLIREGVPAFLRIQGSEARPKPSTRATTKKAGARIGVTDNGMRTIRAAGGRLEQFALTASDADFQLAAAYYAVARRSSPGWVCAGVPLERLLELPGNRAGSRRSSATISAAKESLAGAGRVRLVTPAVAPGDGVAGRTTQFELVALLVHDPRRQGPRDDIMRIPRREWVALVWSVPPFALRVTCWLIATKSPGEVFSLAASFVAARFSCAEPRAAAAISALVGRVLEVVEPADAGRRRAGAFMLKNGLVVGQPRASLSPSQGETEKEGVPNPPPHHQPWR